MIPRQQSWLLGICPRNTRNTQKPSPTGEAAPAERLEVTRETPPVRKASPFVRRPLPRPAARFAAADFACLAAVHASNGKPRRMAVPDAARSDVRAALGRGSGDRQRIFRVFRVFRGKKFHGKLKI